jgi:hypothetical protein
VTGNDLFGIVDLNTGVFTSVGSTGLRLVGLGGYAGIIYGGVDGGSTLYSVNTSTGALTTIGTGNIVYRGFGSTTSGLYAFGANGDLYSINPANGVATDIGPTGLAFGGIVMGMSSGSNTLYLTQNNSLYSLNTTNGSATLIGTTNEGESGFGALVSVGGTLYGGAYDASTPDIYTIDPQTGATTFVAASPSTPSVPGVAGFWGLAPITSFTDNFSPPSTLWSNSSGNWTSSGGKYYAQSPSNSPDTYSGLPFDFTNNFMLTVTINNLRDEGIWLDSDGTINNAVLLVLGGNAQQGNWAYWHIDQNGAQSPPLDINHNAFTPDLTYTVTVIVEGDTYKAYVDPDGVYDGKSVLLTTLVSDVYSHGMVGLYDFWGATSFSNFSITTIQPSVTSITATADNSATDLNAGHLVTISLSFSEAVTVTGTPTLALNDNGIATYDATATAALNDPTKLVFDYTVTSSDSNVASLAVTSINLPNGATIQDGGGNNANLSLSGLTQSGPQIDTTIPTLTAVAETPSTGNLTAGKTVTITLTTNEAVTVAGMPTLTLNDHGTATYSGISTDGKTLTFAYTVASADIDVASLQVSSINLPNGATIRDGGGNNLNLSLSAVPTYSGPAVDQDKVAEPPSLTTSGNVTVSAGGSKPLGITAIPNDSDDTLSLQISNVPKFETITAPTGDVVTRSGNTYTITAPTGQAINNLMVHSSYNGKGHPQNTFNITATNLTVGETATSASSIKVTDPSPTAPGATPPSLDHVVVLFNQYIAAGFPDQHGALNTNPLSQIVTNQEQFLANPRHG